MDPSKLYVPNPQKWVTFFDKVADGKARFVQSGGARNMEILPLDRYSKENVTPVTVKAVTPAEQTVQQAASELKREDINPTELTKMVQKTKRRRKRRTSKKGRIVKIVKKRQVGGRRKKQFGGRKKQSGGKKRHKKSRKVRAKGKSNSGARRSLQDIFGS